MTQSTELMVDDVRDASASLDRTLGPLAGLLIAKWASHDESEREAIAAFNEEAFTPELPEALRLSAWSDPTTSHAGEVAEALRGMTAPNGAGSVAARYAARVAPLVAHTAERSRPSFERLYACVRQIEFGTPDGRTLAARMFDDVLRTVMARQGRQVGEFATPERVADLMLELADPEPGHKVYDPCFGFGELLVGATRRLREAARTASPRVWADIREAGIFGIEVDPIAYAVGLCRILLAGIDRPGLELSDALERPLPRNRSGDGFDRILAVPPWGMRVSRTSAAHFPFPNRHSETLFLQHVMTNLRPGGRAVVALPEGPLYRHGSDRQVRKALLSDYSVDAVVSLPAGAFAPWTGIAVNLLVFRRAAPRSTIRFVSISANAWESALEAGGDGIPDVVESEGNDPGTREYGFPGGDVSGDRFGSGAGIEDESRFGGGVESSAGIEGGSILGRGAGPDAGSGNGSDLGCEETPSVGSDDGTRYGYGHVPPVGLLRGVPELIRHRHELSGKAFRSGVEVWDVAVRGLGLRGYELVARKPESKALDAEMERLVALDSSVMVERLERVANVSRGAKYGRRLTTRSRDAADVLVGLLRAGDVRDVVGGVLDAGIQAPSLFLAEKGAERVDERHILRSLDVIVTTSSTVGRVAFIPPSIARIKVEGTSTPADGGDGYLLGIGGLFMPVVATDSVAVIRARERVTPEFLVALLRSPVYRNWLSSHARGSDTRTLPTRTLRGLRVPLPPLQVQDAVLDEVARSGGDAMAVLLRLLSRAANEPVAVWLETPAAARLASGVAIHDPDQFSTLVAATRALQSLMDRMSRRAAPVSSESNDPWLGAWLGIARGVAAVLGGIESIPRGTGRLAVLGVALSRLREALSALDGARGATVYRLHVFTRTMVELSEREVHAMQESIKLDIVLEPAEVVVGKISEVQLRLTNSSVTPLRSLHISTRPSVGAGQLPYLTDGETHHLPLTVHPRDAMQPLYIVVFWRARRLDGAAVSGESELSLRVLSTREAASARLGAGGTRLAGTACVLPTREAVRTGDLGSSPYIVGSPVDRREMFFGRTDVMDRIKRQLGAGTHANVILLEGNRRTGKTSILRQLGEADVLPGWIPVYCSFQDAEGDSTHSGVTTRNVFRLLARTIGWALYDAGIETWFPGLSDRDTGRPFKQSFRAGLDHAFGGEHLFEAFELYIEAALEAASPRRVLLMLDEFDKLQEGIDAGITSPQVPENIRHLLQHQSGMSAIITGSRRLKRLREEYWSALFGLGHRIGISALANDDARRLVTEPVEGRLVYLPQARDRLVELCAGHPFLIQSLCNRVFERAASGGGPTITLDAVERAATEMVQDNEHFRTLWDYAGSARRRLLLALCDRFSEEPDAVNLDLLGAKLRDYEVPFRRATDLADDIEELRELELLDVDGSYRGGTYRLSVPLMANWLRTNVNFGELLVRARQEAMEAVW